MALTLDQLSGDLCRHVTMKGIPGSLENNSEYQMAASYPHSHMPPSKLFRTKGPLDCQMWVFQLVLVHNINSSA